MNYIVVGIVCFILGSWVGMFITALLAANGRGDWKDEDTKESID